MLFISSPGLPSWVYDCCIHVDTQSLRSKWSHVCSLIFHCCYLENCNLFSNLGHGACGSWTLAHMWSHLYCLSGMDSQLPTCHSWGLYLFPYHPCVIHFRRWDQVPCYEEICGLRLLSAPKGLDAGRERARLESQCRTGGNCSHSGPYVL